MDIFNLLSLLGGLALFLYGMNVMGEGLTRAAGGKMEQILEKLTSTPIKGVLLGAAVTAIIQKGKNAMILLALCFRRRNIEKNTHRKKCPVEKRKGSVLQELW